MHYDGKNEKTQLIIFLEIYLFFKLNLKKTSFFNFFIFFVYCPIWKISNATYC